MKQLTTEINAGAAAPFELLHISDTHLTLADNRDCERKNVLAAERVRYFPDPEDSLAEAVAYARERGALLVHTGDLLDFVSEANLDRAKRFTDENDIFFAAGNHEFSLFVGEAFEDAEYRAQSLDKVQAAFKNNIRFCSRKLNGVNLIGIDDSYYRFEPWQLEKLRAEIALGLPILLFMHNPIYEPELYRVMRGRAESAYLNATPEELMQDYSEYRYRQQKADDCTLETVELIRSCPLIKGIFTGHLHFDYDGMLTENIPQVVTGIGTGRSIRVR